MSLLNGNGTEFKKLNIAIDIDETIVNINPKLYALKGTTLTEQEILLRENFYVYDNIDNEYFANPTFYDDLELNKFGQFIKMLYDNDRIGELTFVTHHNTSDEFKHGSKLSKDKFIEKHFPTGKIMYVPEGVCKSTALDTKDFKWDCFIDDRISVIKSIILNGVSPVFKNKELFLLMYNYNVGDIEKLGGADFVIDMAIARKMKLTIIDIYNFDFSKFYITKEI